MKQTDYVIDEKKISYEITSDGYEIYLDDEKWITQNEPYIPYPELGYEGSCLKQIEELYNSSLATDDESGEMQEPILSETDEAILNTNMNVEYLVALQEMNLYS